MTAWDRTRFVRITIRLHKLTSPDLEDAGCPLARPLHRDVKASCRNCINRIGRIAMSEKEVSGGDHNLRTVARNVS